jgi:hypothetical protein
MSEDNIKRMSISEFHDLGYLQEANRRFFHPLGLALEIVKLEDGTESLGGIWDYRCDPEGMYFDIDKSDEKRKKRFFKNEQFVNNEIEKRRHVREVMFGSIIEAIPNDGRDWSK